MNEFALAWQSFPAGLLLSLFAATLSYLSCLQAMSMAKRSDRIAHPGPRQSHKIATVTGGGLGLIFSIIVTSVSLQFLLPLPGFWWQHMLPGILLLAIIGWRDDKTSVSSLLRLSVQLAVSLWLLSFFSFQFSLRDIGVFLSSILAMIWVMNLYNFMDGSNGMAGFQGIFAGMVLAALFYTGGHNAMALLSLIVAATCAGFLPLNFPQARVFMGDVASVPLGFIFASLAVYGMSVGILSLPVSILIMSVFVMDATLTLLARVFRGERWYTAHAQHVYQRLIAQGWSHRRVLVVYQAVNVILVLPAIVLAAMYSQYAVVIAGFTFFLLGACWHFANRRLGTLAKVELK